MHNGTQQASSGVTGLSPHYAAVANYPMIAPLTAQFEFTPAAATAADKLIAAGANRLYTALIADVEGDGVALAALQLLRALFDRPADAASLQTLLAEAAAARAELAPQLASLASAQAEVLAERAPLALLGDCWLDSISQAATQPASVVNLLFGQQFADRGRINSRTGQAQVRRRALEDAGITLPHLMDSDFLLRAAARPITAWHGSSYLALARYGASYLPEIVGLHCAHRLLGVDDQLLGLAPVIAEADLVAVLTEFYAFADGPDGDSRLVERLACGFRTGLALEDEHVAVLADIAERARTATLDAKVAAMLARHAPYAGRQHRNVRVGGELLTEALDAENFDAIEFMRTLRSSRQVKPMRDGNARLVKAIRFGGPMFGIFDDAEAGLLAAWVAEIEQGGEPDPNPQLDTLGALRAEDWQARVEAVELADVSFAEPGFLDDRELLHRLVNVERFQSVLPIARAHAESVLARSQLLFQHGAAGRYTDASYFDYTPDALAERVERIYFDKLVEPYRPLTEIADLDEVVFGQKTFALGSLIDGTWAHRIGRVARFDEVAEQKLWSIYADEMGRGDIRKNHITLIYRVLASMAVELPHLADPAFLEQAELPDSLYGFSLHQLSLALFSDTMRDEILGYNLGIEMFGLGEMRMHEIQKLRHHNLDDCYEAAHLSIDNVSAGHARQSANIIVAHLDRVARLSGPESVQRQWRRIWNGYASFAYFIEHPLVRSVTAQPAEVVDEFAELTI